MKRFRLDAPQSNGLGQVRQRWGQHVALQGDLSAPPVGAPRRNQLHPSVLEAGRGSEPQVPINRDRPAPLWEPSSETGDPEPCKGRQIGTSHQASIWVIIGVDVRSGQTGFQLVTWLCKTGSTF